MIAEKLIAEVRQRFPTARMSFGAPPEAAVVFEAVHPDVGSIQIFDDGAEATVIAGNFTHGHFSDFDSKSIEDAEKRIVHDVIEFLERLFTDEIVLWGSHRGGGGWYDRSKAGKLSQGTGQALYVWSGPLKG